MYNDAYKRRIRCSISVPSAAGRRRRRGIANLIYANVFIIPGRLDGDKGDCRRPAPSPGVANREFSEADRCPLRSSVLFYREQHPTVFLWSRIVDRRSSTGLRTRFVRRVLLCALRQLDSRNPSQTLPTRVTYLPLRSSFGSVRSIGHGRRCRKSYWGSKAEHLAVRTGEVMRHYAWVTVDEWEEDGSFRYDHSSLGGLNFLHSPAYVDTPIHPQ